MDIKTQLNIMFTVRKMRVAKLAELMSTETGRHYTASSLYGKINRDTISFTECQIIAKLLNYELMFKDLENI